MKIYKYCLFGLVAVLIAACGGGGGDAKKPDGDGPPKANVITLTVVNASDTEVNNIVYGGGQRIKVKYTTSTGAAIPNVLITYSVVVNASAARLDHTTEITNSSGVAYVNVSPSSASAVGAASVTATAGTVSSTVDFGISATDVTLSELTLGTDTPLVSGGTTTAIIYAGANSVVTSGVSVAFSATCGTLTPSIVQTDGNGKALSIYSAIRSDGTSSDGTSCTDAVTVRAIAAGSTKTASLSVLAPIASAINFVSALPNQIYVQGSGAAGQSLVTFKVLDAQGKAISGQVVTASLVSNPGGVGLNASGATGKLTLTSNVSGLVTFTVFSGTFPGPVEVRVDLTVGNTFAVSRNLTIQSGLPSQKFFSLAADRYNLEGRDYEGTNASITIRTADRNGNPVPAGTVVNFTAEGGQISPSCTLSLVDGIALCSVTFSSQSPRPSDGRISILAYAEGLKDFIDNNGNNTFDAGDTLIDMGDAYRDDNESRAYEPGEFVLSHGGKETCPDDIGTSPSRANTCDSKQLSTTMRRQLVLIMSGSDASFSIVSLSANQIGFSLTDEDGSNPMPAGTSIASTVTDNTPNNNLACTVVKTAPSTILSTSNSRATPVVITLSKCDAGDQVAVDVTTPKGRITPMVFTIPAPLGVLFDTKIISLVTALGANATISGGVAPFTVESSDNTVATVALNGNKLKVTGLTAGTARIKVKDNNEGSIVSTVITVE